MRLLRRPDRFGWDRTHTGVTKPLDGLIPITAPVRFGALPAEVELQTPPHWDVLSAGRLQALTADAAARGAVFTDDIALTATGAVPDAGELILTPGLTSYHRWAVSSGSLDRLLTREESAAIPGPGTTLRQRWKANPRTLQETSALPSPAKAGAGVAAVTSDGYLVLGVRTRAYVAGASGGSRANVHVVAEGMLPEDINDGGDICSTAAARRGLAEELGVATAEISLTGVFLDVQRWQPIFAHIAYLNETLEQVRSLAAQAPDAWEADRIIGVPLKRASALAALVGGSHPELVAASNHARAFISAAARSRTLRSVA